MKTSIFVALALVGLFARDLVAAPNLIDYPGPGYRLQKELYAPREGKSISFLWFTPTLFVQKTSFAPSPLRTDKPTGLIETIPTDNPFTEPIRLFENSKN
jgi:hypothetical protein